MRSEDVFRAREREDQAFARAWAEEQPCSNLGLNVYRYRRSKGLTQKELGRRAGLSQPKIARIERGDGNPELRTVGRLAFALGESASTLLADPYQEIADRAAIVEAIVAKTRSVVRAEMESLPEWAWGSATPSSATASAVGAAAANSVFKLAVP